jgi:hypothetical protein
MSLRPVRSVDSSEFGASNVIKMDISGCDGRGLCVQSDVICDLLEARVLVAGFFSPAAHDGGPIAHE